MSPNTSLEDYKACGEQTHGNALISYILVHIQSKFSCLKTHKHGVCEQGRDSAQGPVVAS